MDERVPTEADWRRMAKAMGWGEGCDWEFIDGFYVYLPGTVPALCQHPPSYIRELDCLRDHNDLARLVEAMQGQFGISRMHCVDGSTITTVDVFERPKGTLLKDGEQASEVHCPTDREATCWAILEALKAEEDRDAKRASNCQ